MGVDWGGKIHSNYTSRINHGPSLMEVDWGGSIDPNYTSSGCMLMQFDWGRELRVNHINECMPSEVDWGAHETHQNGHSITKVDWRDYDPTLYPMDGYILSEVDCGAHDSSLFLYLVHINHDAKPKDFFTQGLWGGLTQRASSIPLMEYMKDSFDTGQIEDGFSNSKSFKGYRSSYSLPDPEQYESSYNLLTQWDPGEKPLQPPLFRKESTSELTAKTNGSDRIFIIKLGLSQSLMVKEGAHNCNVTIRAHPKRFWGVFGQKAHKTQQITLSHPEKGVLSLTQMIHGQTNNPKCNTSIYPTKLWGFSWDGLAYSMCNTAKFPDWLNSQN